MNRGSLFALSIGLAFVSGSATVGSAEDEPPATAMSTSQAPSHLFDHLVLGISDLDAGVERFTARTGVEPVFGGEHPHTGTHNALSALGATSYVEIVAPRPGVETEGSPLAGWLATLGELTPVLWAVASSDAEATRELLAAAGFETSEPTAGSRRTPAGEVLEWRTFGLTSPQLAAAPFFIEWGSATKHPASTSPRGCSLVSLAVVSNDNEAMVRLLEVLGVEARVDGGPRPTLVAELECPTGPVTLAAPEAAG